MLFIAGDVGTELFIVASGELACIAPDGNEVRVLEAGACFGELAALGLNCERSLTVRPNVRA